MIEVLGKPLVDFSTIKPEFCLGECTDFTNLTTLVDSSASVINTLIWSFGNGQISTLENPTHCYDEIGDYTVKLVVLTNNGCVDSIVKTNSVVINPLPIAGFRIQNETINTGDQTIFSDASQGATHYLYNFGDGNNSVIPNPIHNYKTAGLFSVQQTVVNQFGCVDSISQLIEVKERTAMYVPSAFTPNNDGDNDEFRPVFNSIDIRKYNFKVFNRWGELLFETTDYNETWDGTHNGVKVPQGTYIWKVAYKELNGYGVFNESGHVNVLW